jgi:hypothetical protein
MDVEITPQLIRSIAGLAGITVPEQDVEALAAVLANQVRTAERLRSLDYLDVPPIVSLDPRW